MLKIKVRSDDDPCSIVNMWCRFELSSILEETDLLLIACLVVSIKSYFTYMCPKNSIICCFKKCRQKVNTTDVNVTKEINKMI